MATRALKPGQVILRDQPLLILKKSEIRDKVRDKVGHGDKSSSDFLSRETF